MASERVVILIGACVAVLLQLLVAPYIVVFGAVPNVIAAYALAVAVMRSSSANCLLPFVLGLAYDFMGSGPIGAMAFTLMAISILVARVFSLVDNDSLFMSFSLLALGALLVEVAYAIFMLVTGYGASLADALIYRVVPSFLYDMACSFVLYLVLMRFAKPKGAVRTELTQLR